MTKEKDWELVQARERFLIKEIIPSRLFQHLVSILTEADKENVQADDLNHGHQCATRTLINRLRRRGENAFPTFVVALRAAGYPNAALLLDPKSEVLVEKCYTELKEDDGIAIAGVIADIKIEIEITSRSGGRLSDKEKFIAECYLDARTDKAIELRDHFEKSLFKEMEDRFKPVFVKTKSTAATPLILIFRLCNESAAETLWREFKNGNLRITLGNVLMSYEKIKETFLGEELEIIVRIPVDSYDKVLRTLRDTKDSVFVDGEEKKELVLKEVQEEAASPALKGENTIICAPTGFGKTFIAIKIIKEHLSSPERKKIVFIVNTVSLVQQQLERLDVYLPEGVCVSSLCGNVDGISLGSVLKSSDVVVLTAQVLVNALEKGGTVTISNFSLLVFDECHHTKDSHAYNNIMRFYIKEKFSEEKPVSLPQVLGLSASLGIGAKNPNCHEEKARQHILEICANLDAHCLQVLEDDRQSTNTKFIPIPREEISEFKQYIKGVMEEIENYLLSILEGAHGSRSLRRGSQSYENWVVEICKRSLGRDLVTCAEHLREYNNALMISEDLRTKDALSYLEETIKSKEETGVELWLRGLYEKTRESFSRQESHEVNAWLQRVEELLLEKFPVGSNDNTSRVIIFARTRFVAVALVDWMKSLEKLEGVIKPTYVIGCSHRNGKEGMTKVQQDEQIKKFRDGQYNVIAGTSVLVEGIDIQDCDFVINYGMPGNEITFVQARGRVRTAGEFVIIVEPSEKEAKMQDLKKEKLMKEVIAKIENMATNEFQREVTDLQKKAYNDHRKLLAAKSEQQKLPLVDGIKLHCLKCDVFACEAKDVKIFCNVHHLVPEHEQTLKSMKFRETKKKNIHINLIKIGEIFCENCDKKWGSMATNQHGRFPCVAISNFRVKCDGTERSIVYKQWKDFPYEILKFDP